MEASTTTGGKIGRKSPSDMLSTRGGAVLVATVAAILAGILLFVFVQRYRTKDNASSATTPVFVAKSLIPQGSSADLIGSEQLLQRTTLRGSQVQAGAIADPSVLHGEVATRNIYPGQQITAADFAVGGGIISELAGPQRGMAVPVDTAHGLVGFVHTGDHVDVLGSYSGGLGSKVGAVVTLFKDVLVLNAQTSSSGGLGSNNNNSNVVLRITDRQAPVLAYAVDNGKVWIVLRPALGATDTTKAAADSSTTTAATTTSSGH
jgi:Flp pilus assembly protein CpaB